MSVVSDFKPVKQISPDDFETGLFQFSSDKYQAHILMFLEEEDNVSLAVCKYFDEARASIEDKVLAISYASLSNMPIEEFGNLDSYSFEAVKGNTDFVITKEDIAVFKGFITDAKVFRMLSNSNIVPIPE